MNQANMTPQGVEHPNLEAVYDEKIHPLMTQIVSICKEHGMPFLACFQYEGTYHHQVSATPDLLLTGAQSRSGGEAGKVCGSWSWRQESNLQPPDYKLGYPFVFTRHQSLYSLRL